MKIKTLAVLAASGLMAASIAYVVPAFAEESFDEASAMQLAMADDNSGAASTDNSASSSDNAASSDKTDSSSNGSNTSGSSGSGSDQGSTPDVPTGDDDF